VFNQLVVENFDIGPPSVAFSIRLLISLHNDKIRSIPHPDSPLNRVTVSCHAKTCGYCAHKVRWLGLYLLSSFPKVRRVAITALSRPTELSSCCCVHEIGLLPARRVRSACAYPARPVGSDRNEVADHDGSGSLGRQFCSPVKEASKLYLRCGTSTDYPHTGA
jgi:hypothetical protein